MFCHGCGAQIQPGQQYCGVCGTAIGGFRAASAVAPARNRVCGHVRTLGILWIVASALRVLPVIGLHWFQPFGREGWPYWGGFPGHWVGIIGAIATLWALTGLLGILAGWGLLDRQPWARMLAIVLGCIALIHLPFGTALGIYTLWVLLPAESEEEYRRSARA
jgi:hypothetical protein